jgi:hypothetical protein
MFGTNSSGFVGRGDGRALTEEVMSLPSFRLLIPRSRSRAAMVLRLGTGRAAVLHRRAHSSTIHAIGNRSCRRVHASITSVIVFS